MDLLIVLFTFVLWVVLFNCLLGIVVCVVVVLGWAVVVFGRYCLRCCCVVCDVVFCCVNLWLFGVAMLLLMGCCVLCGLS